MIQPFFSICIAAYNSGGSIVECLCSITMQDCQDYEVIVVDDGSRNPINIDDSVAARLSSFSLRRISNRGPYAARQVAFDIAQGEYILCFDADDKLLDSSALSELKSVLTNHDVDIVIYNASASEQEPRRLFDFSSLGESGFVDERAIWRLFTEGYSLNSLWCKAFKRSLYTRDVKKRPRLLMAEDRLQSLEIMRNASTYWLLDSVLYFYRPAPTSTTGGRFDPAYYHQACYVEEEVFSYMMEHNMGVGPWARYYLEFTSRALLGIRYNGTLSWAARRDVYESVRNEKVLALAQSLHTRDSLPWVDAFRLLLLRAGYFAALDVSLLPWQVGSILKRFVKNFISNIRG
ncbi:MAG TPA: glycosyltransferase family 2 protein [Candidatus Coprousia avicola]|nr:glycosyltransferase family 2 protein [Candidatus Coprousia avicola]